MKKTDLYIASCRRDGALIHAVLSEDGTLMQRSRIGADRPTFLAKEGKTLYFTLREPFPGEGGVASVELDGSGDFKLPSEVLAARGALPCHLAVKNGVVYTANYLSGSVTRLPDKTVRHSGRGPVPGRQEAPHVHQLIFAPDQSCLAAVDLGADQIVSYTEELQKISVCRMPKGSGPRHLAFSPDQKTAFCSNELSNDVSILHYENGRFRFLERCPALPAGWSGFSKAAAIRCSGEYVFISHRGFDAVTQFLRTGDRLKKTGDLPTFGKSPVDFALTKHYMICCNAESDTVTVLRRNEGNAREPISQLVVPSPVCVLIG